MFTENAVLETQCAHEIFSISIQLPTLIWTHTLWKLTAFNVIHDTHTHEHTLRLRDDAVMNKWWLWLTPGLSLLNHPSILPPPPPPPPLCVSPLPPGTWEATGLARSCALWTRSPSPSTSRRPQRRSSSRRRWRRCPTRPCCSPWRCRSVAGRWPSTSPRPPPTGYGSCWSFWVPYCVPSPLVQVVYIPVRSCWRREGAIPPPGGGEQAWHGRGLCLIQNAIVIVCFSVILWVRGFKLGSVEESPKGQQKILIELHI